MCVFKLKHLPPNPSHIYISLATNDHWAPCPVTKRDELRAEWITMIFVGVVFDVWECFWASSPECFMENIGLKVGVTSFQTYFFEKNSQRKKQRKVTTESGLVSPKIHRIFYCVFWQPPIRPYGEWQNSPTWLPQEHSISMMMSINSIWEINSSSKKLPLGIVFLRSTLLPYKCCRRFIVRGVGLFVLQCQHIAMTTLCIIRSVVYHHCDIQN